MQMTADDLTLTFLDNRLHVKIEDINEHVYQVPESGNCRFVVWFLSRG